MASDCASKGLYDDEELRSDQGDIRILQIRRAIDDEPLVCTLKRLSLKHTNLAFNALSYVWGDPADTVPLTVNGIIINVTKSLEKALRHFRDFSAYSSDPPPLIWADGICINQTDLAERNQQVQLMGRIYASATQLMVWLGDGNEHTDAAIDLMNSAEFQRELDLLKASGRQPLPEEIRVEAVMKLDLCRRDWWKRLWVRQELILAKLDPILLCGRKSIRWSLFLDCFMTLPRQWDFPGKAAEWKDWHSALGASELETRYNTGIHPLSLERMRRQYHRKSEIPLPQLVRYLLRNSAATDPRDFIYGLLGLMNSQDSDGIAVDYTLKPMMLYRQVACILWTRYASATLAELVPALRFHGEKSGFPSWVPDLEQRETRGWRDDRVLQAEKPWRRAYIRFMEADDCLVLKGIKIDTLESIIPTPSGFESHEEMRAELQRLEAIMLAAVRRKIPENSALHPLRSLKLTNTILETLTKSPLVTEDMSPPLTDEQLWEILLGRAEPPLDASDSIAPMFSRFMTILEGKFFNRAVIITEAGFVGVGAPQMRKGDIVTCIYGSTTRLVLRSYGDHYRMVGAAYVSGLMDVSVLDKLIDKHAIQGETFNIR